MRLLYLCSDFGISPAGTKGASIHVRAITRGLADRGHDVLLMSPKDGPGNGHPAKFLKPAERNPAYDTSRMLKHWLTERNFNDAAARELRPLIYNAWIGEHAGVLLAERRPDAIIERLSLFGHTGVDLADRFDVPLIVEVNAPLAEEASRYRSLQLQALAEEIERRVLQRADAIVAVSSRLADCLAEAGVDRYKTHVVPNGVDTSCFDALPPASECKAGLGLNGSFVIGFVGSLKVWHGVEVLLSAFERLAASCPSAHLLIVGTGPREQALRDKVCSSRLAGAVTFTGAIPHAQVPKLIRAMDVAVAPFLPMDRFYFSPIKLYEYMAAGVCVIASRLGQIAEVIDEDVNGLLFQAADVDDLAGQLNKAAASPELRVRLGTRGAHTVRERLTWAHTAAATEQVVQMAMERGTGTASAVARDCPDSVVAKT